MVIIIPTVKYGSPCYITFTMEVCSNYHGFFFSVTWGNLNVAGCQVTVENLFFIINEESQWFDQVEFGRFLLNKRAMS